MGCSLLVYTGIQYLRQTRPSAKDKAAKSKYQNEEILPQHPVIATIANIVECYDLNDRWRNQSQGRAAHCTHQGDNRSQIGYNSGQQNF